MTPYERLTMWLVNAEDRGHTVTFFVAPQDVCDWIVTDRKMFDPYAPDHAEYEGLPVIAGPGYGVGGAA